MSETPQQTPRAETQKPGLLDFGCMTMGAELILWTIAILAFGLGASEPWARLIGIVAGGLALLHMLGRWSRKRRDGDSDVRRGGEMFESESSLSSSSDAGD